MRTITLAITLLIALVLVGFGCATEHQPNPMHDAGTSEWNFDSATGRWQHTNTR